MNIYQEKDLAYIWHPCSQMKDYEDFPPIVIEKGEGVYLYDVNGKCYLDCISSWWTNLFGHSNKRINQALQNQVEHLEHVVFANFSNKPAITLAENLVAITPEPLKKVYFSDNGSSAVEVALKMSFHYHQIKGNTKKTKFTAISDAYHGETLGALSVGDLDLYSKIYKPLLMDTIRVAGPDCYRCKYGENREHCNAQCFEHMEKVIEDHHEDLCGVIIEPMVQGAGGMKIYSPVYLQKLRKICDAYDIHFIADEIAVGFGRTGTMFACEHGNVSPDLMCLSKGITAGYMPMSVVMMTQAIYDAFYADYRERKTFIHSHTYAGNALACAVACESLKIFEEENILHKNKEKSQLIKDLALSRANNHPYIGEIRQLGMITAVELVKDKYTKESFPWEDRVAYYIAKIGLNHGMILRPMNNSIYFMPPYIIEQKDIEKMVHTTFDCIDAYFK
ncbi:adenosylmethionine--8-amino-7-oxononanoate transaminase [Clostridiaceae bacterium 35-E11]